MSLVTALWPLWTSGPWAMLVALQPRWCLLATGGLGPRGPPRMLPAKTSLALNMMRGLKTWPDAGSCAPLSLARFRAPIFMTE
eukprot:15247588-Alexandrium_andersonii.AAC.1